MQLLSFIYNTKQAIRSCPEEVLFAAPSKAIFSGKDTDQVKSLNWFLSKRVNFIVSSDLLFIGKKEIPRDSVESVKYYGFIANVIPIKYVVLKIKLNSNQFIYIGCNKSDLLLENLKAVPVSIQHKNNAVYFLWAAFIVMVFYYFIK